MKKIVLILYTAHHAGPHTPFSDVKYQRCYETLYTLGETVGLHLCRAPLDWYDTDRDIFKKSWEFVDGVWHISGPVKPDLVYDKTSGDSDDDSTRAVIISRYRFVDDPAFTRFASNKYEMSRRLPRHFKPYRKISSVAGLARLLKTYTGDKIVIKPIIGSGGTGVYIVSKEEALKLKLSFPVIVQEFIDSSGGIPGLTTTYHDLRMVFIGKELVYSYIRTPKKGSFLANIAQGGSMRIIPNSKLPESLQPIISDTRDLFAVFTEKTYTIDVMFDGTGRPWVIEYNTMPGMFFPTDEKATMLRVYKRLLRELKKSLTTPDQRVALEKKPTQYLSVVILFTPFRGEGKLAFQEKALCVAYTAFAELAQREGVKLYRSSTNWYDKKRARFHLAWHWNGKDWVLTDSIVPDVIYDKSTMNPATLPIKRSLLPWFPMVNHPEFSEHAGSKLAVSRAFERFAKPYFVATSQTELKNSVGRVQGHMAVVKPERGNSGEGVLILDKKALLLETHRYPILVQEFVNSEAGIPGVMTGLHDLRLIFSNNDLVYSYYRTPKKGSYLANLAQGGMQTMVLKEQIPAAVWPIVKTIQDYYANFSEKIYAIDLMFDRNGTPWIVELNTMPGLYPDESERPHIEKLYLAILSALKRAAKRKK